MVAGPHVPAVVLPVRNRASVTALAGLAGVFLGPNTPSGPAPAQLSGTSYSSISPGLDQIFFIGDGLTGTGSGTVQTFYVPTGATRLYLGVIDDGGYYDNTGTIIATITASEQVSTTPAPSAWVLMISGLVGLGFVAYRRRFQNLVAHRLMHGVPRSARSFLWPLVARASAVGSLA